MPVILALTKQQDDAITLALVAVLALIVIVVVIRKAVSLKNAPAAPEAQKPIAFQPKEAPGSAGQLKLHNVEPKTAAMLMAIVADKLQKPINELRFISIKEVE